MSDHTIHLKIVERSHPQQDRSERHILCLVNDLTVVLTNILSPMRSHLDQCCG